MNIPAIQTVDLCKTFYSGFLRRKNTGLDHLNLQVHEGEILGYLGPNGSGKTTTFKLLLGLITPAKGRILFFGQDIRGGEYRHRIGYLPENPYFYPYLTAEESLAFHGRLHGMEAGLLRQRTDELLKLVGLEHARGRQLRKFSRGMLQRIGIAQALVNDPQLLILDEPMSGLDPFGRKEMRDIILSCRDQGKTVIFSSHILSDVEMMCNRAAIILHGKLRDVVSVKEMLGRDIRYWEITCTDVAEQILLAYEQQGVEVVRTGKQILCKIPREQQAVALLKAIDDTGGRLLSFIPHRESLEDIFVQYTGGKEQ